MRLSNYFLPILKEAPSEAHIISHKLMLRSGMIKQIAAGIYNWLPFGLAVLAKIEHIIREEMNNILALELLVPCIQPAALWKKSGRFGIDNDLNNEMLKMHDRSKQEMIFTPTAEEAIVDIASSIQSYKSLPINLYQISWKFRDEIRPRYGVMRSREFLMKDAYSFHINKECALKTYEKVMQAYLRIYQRLELSAVPVAANTGAIGGDYSHEFHVLADTGESLIYYEEGLDHKLQSSDITLEALNGFYAAEEEKHDAKNVPINTQIVCKKGIEVGHIFYLGDKYSRAMNMKVQDKDGNIISPDMGCYGIGVSRLVGALIEAHHDDNGMIWPNAIAPFKFILLNLKTSDDECNAYCDQIIKALDDLNMTYLYDDLQDNPGAKFARADLLGLPYQIIISARHISNKALEIKNRKTGIAQIIKLENLTQYIQSL